MLLLAPLALADPTVHLGAGWRVTQYPMLYEGMPWRQAVGGEAALRLPSGLEFGAGARLVLPAGAEPSFAFEGDLGAGAVATIGRWRPGAGVEIGFSSRSDSEVLQTERPPGSYFAALGRPEPLWIDFVATPARFSLGEWELSVARVGVGVSLPHFGMVGRVHLDVLTVTRTF